MQFSGKLAVLAFPTNQVIKYRKAKNQFLKIKYFQFGHQENSGGQEIVNALKHVRPGNGFEFKGELFDKVAF